MRDTLFDETEEEIRAMEEMKENLKAVVDDYGYYNGRSVIFFTLWEWQESEGLPGAWVHAGKFNAPRRTPAKRLVDVALEQLADREERDFLDSVGSI